jgi:hypothetical protein
LSAKNGEVLRLTASIRQGTVTASLILRKLGSYPRQNRLALALREIGPEKGFHIACQDLQPERRFVVNAGFEQFPIGPEATAIGLPAIAKMLHYLST